MLELLVYGFRQCVIGCDGIEATRWAAVTARTVVTRYVDNQRIIHANFPRTYDARRFLRTGCDSENHFAQEP
jgi:hypothetical protein